MCRGSGLCLARELSSEKTAKKTRETASQISGFRLPRLGSAGAVCVISYCWFMVIACLTRLGAHVRWSVAACIFLGSPFEKEMRKASSSNNWWGTEFTCSRSEFSENHGLDRGLEISALGR